MKKILMNFCIVIAMLFVSIVPTFATDIKNIGTTNVPVTATVNSSFTVTIPKSIDISNENASYNIGVSGDLAGNEKLTVVPTQTFEMKEKNNFKQPVTATVTQDKKEWSYTDVAASIGTSGSIAANLSAGDWTGVLAFTVDIKQEFKPEGGTLVDGLELSRILSEEMSINVGDITSVNFCKDGIPEDYLQQAKVISTPDSKYLIYVYVYYGSLEREMYIYPEKNDIVIYGNSNCEGLFDSYSEVESINFENFNTSNVITTSAMFYSCSKLKFVNIEDWDISKLVNKENMFLSCPATPPSWY